jgi:hypothetical protein
LSHGSCTTGFLGHFSRFLTATFRSLQADKVSEFAFGASVCGGKIPFLSELGGRKMLLQGIGRNDRDAVYPPVFAIADGFCCGLSGIEAEDCSLASLRQIFLTLPAAGAQRSVLGGKIADTRRPGPPPVGGGTRLWYSCYDIFLREGQPMTHETPPFSADAALRHFRSYFTEPKDVVAHPQLSRDEKLAILREWEQDALRLSTSESEGMGGGEESMLGRVEESIGILERSPR